LTLDTLPDRRSRAPRRAAAPTELDRTSNALGPRPVLVLNNVTKTYPNGRNALKEVDLVVPEGDFVFLVGPSGAGKSTLMKLLIRDEVATEGTVYLDGDDLA
jgi:ABC-type bacteriocin/lantibiotic exporter with double-glycine peptidase domain